MQKITVGKLGMICYKMIRNRTAKDVVQCRKCKKKYLKSDMINCKTKIQATYYCIDCILIYKKGIYTKRYE